MKKLHSATILLATCLLASGASGLITQYIVTGISSQLLGNTLHQLAVVVGLMMLGYGLAAMIQQTIQNKLIGWFVFIESSLAVLAGLSPLIMQWAYGNVPEHFVLIQYMMAFGIGGLVGLEIPLVMRINEQFVSNLDRNLATTFSWDYIGAAGGSLIFIWLLSRTGLNEIALVTSGINLTIAVVTFVYFNKLKSTRTFAFGMVALGITAMTLLVASVNQKEWRYKNLALLYDDPVQIHEKTPFQDLVITHAESNDDWRLFINGNLQFSSVDEHIYHENLVHPAAQFLETQKVVLRSSLILGGGDGIAARELWKYDSMKDITLVDLDKKMTDIARENSILSKINKGALDRTNVISDDAYEFIKKTPGEWDFVIVDFPDPNHINLNKLYSYEFYRNLHKGTKDDVMIVVQSTSPMHATETFLCIQRTMQAAGWNILPYHDNVPTFGDWGWILAWKNEWTSDFVAKSLAQKIKYSVKTKHVYPRQFLASSVFGKSIRSRHNSINTNNNPFIVNYYIDESEVWN